ncbi:MAG: hypothetical protein JW794_09805 [Candidatus Cloacimonetes bacterium]|nr:hypothetical protein [Candidatus Cloacimonadota bacterium]
MKNNDNFETQWLTKLQLGLEKINKSYLFNDIRKFITETNLINWTQNLMAFLSENLSESEIKEVMISCACLTPKDNLKHIQEEYTRTKDIQHVHNLLQQQFESFIRGYKKLDNEQIDFLRKNGWGMAGKLNGKVIYATKIPKEFHNYFSEKDKKKKQYYYCHCPRIRTSILENRLIDPKYCYCGAGFYKDIWEYILQKEVKIKILKSIMNGDDVCQIAVYLE